MTELRRVVKERLYPFAERQGFVREQSTHPLFTVFRRQRHGKVQVFDVQWDKYHEPFFVINFGEAPLAGVDFCGNHLAADDIEPAHCPAKGRLQRRRGGSKDCWFHPRKSWREALASLTLRYRATEVVDEAILAFAELEDWWATKAEGPHVYMSR